MQRTITIAAGGEYVEQVKGKVFAVKAATAAFDVQLDKDSLQSMAAGSKISGEKFKRVRLIDTSGAANTITFYAGDEDINVTPINASGTATNATLVLETANPIEGIYLIQADDTVEQILPASTASYSNMRIYPAKAAVDGVLTPNTVGDVYVGRSATYLPDKRAVADVDYPVEYTPASKKSAVSGIRVRGKIGDGVFYSYIPA